MTEKEHDIERYFAAARTQPAEPSEALLARVLADAEAVQADLSSPQTGRQARRRPLRALADMFGGWPALAGVAMAGVAGVWIGVSPPEQLDTLALRVLDYDSIGIGVDPVTGFGFDLVEG